MEGATIADLDLDLALHTVHEYSQKLGLREPSAATLRPFLRELGLLVDDDGVECPSIAAILLFGRNPQRFLPHAVVTATDGELYVFAQSADRVAKERAMRRRQLKWLWGRLKQLAGMKLTREELLMRLGAARKQARTAWRLIAIEVAADSATLSYRLDRAKLRRARRREGRYLLRTNLTDDSRISKP